jgi:prepilin-type N-terminal cleavage/methylation domain-containing protein
MEIKKSGFTLLETLIAISAIASVGILIAQVFFTTTRSNTKTELLKDVKQNGDYAIEMMSRIIRNSVSITSQCPPSPGAQLTHVDIKNTDGNIITFGCQDDSSVQRIASTSGAMTDYLTSSNVTLGSGSCPSPVEDFHFTCVSYIDQPSRVTIYFKLSQRGTPVDQFEKASITFQTTVSPRN